MAGAGAAVAGPRAGPARRRPGCPGSPCPALGPRPEPRLPPGPRHSRAQLARFGVAAGQPTLPHFPPLPSGPPPAPLRAPSPPGVGGDAAAPRGRGPHRVGGCAGAALGRAALAGRAQWLSRHGGVRFGTGPKADAGAGRNRAQRSRGRGEAGLAAAVTRRVCVWVRARAREL